MSAAKIIVANPARLPRLAGTAYENGGDFYETSIKSYENSGNSYETSSKSCEISSISS